MSKTIVFFGTDEFSLVTLQNLINHGYNISAVVTKPDNKSGRGQVTKASSVKKLAVAHNIAVWQPHDIKEIEVKITDLDNPIGILVSFGKIIPKSIIKLFNPGIINIHPSLLPKYRGPTPIESVIANNDKQTGVSIMQLTQDMDAGPIYKQINYKLSKDETSLELYNTLAHIGANNLINILPDIINGSLKPINQDEAESTYCKLLYKKDSWLKPTDLTASEAECKIRAHLVFPKTKFNILKRDVIITKAHVTKYQQLPTDILCKDNKYLSIDTLIAPSGRKMSIDDFLNGYKLG
ncbi:MAG: methionyl-tRNA formyltransferase [Patescibacteria group bacterium]|nr:methionyl-tRNA formyltransferase [Patescibacteria group bacterium]